MTGRRSGVEVPGRQAASSLVPVAGWALRRFGAATGGHRVLPSMLVVGTQRGGTTSLFRTLRQHPHFLGPIHRKGVHFFDVEYARGFDWYRGHFPLSMAGRRRGAHVVAGEASPYYMAHPLAGSRIVQHLPDVRLVALLRDPVERAYSAHAHERARGFETEDFETALALEPARTTGERERVLAEPGYQSHALQHNAYLARGHYVDQLEDLASLVGRDRLLVLDSHRFFSNPEREIGRLLDFLGLPPHRGFRYERHNARPVLPLPASVRRRLEDHFSPYDERLARWLGHDPSWRTGSSDG
jgi:Sulfotransferase domain